MDFAVSACSQPHFICVVTHLASTYAAYYCTHTRDPSLMLVKYGVLPNCGLLYPPMFRAYAYTLAKSAEVHILHCLLNTAFGQRGWRGFRIQNSIHCRTWGKTSQRWDGYPPRYINCLISAVEEEVPYCISDSACACGGSTYRGRQLYALLNILLCK